MAPAHPAGCSCGDEDSHQKLEGQLTFLYPFVDRDKAVALNAEEGKEAKIVIRPWDQRNQEGEVFVYLRFFRIRSLFAPTCNRRMARIGCRRTTHLEGTLYRFSQAYVTLLLRLRRVCSSLSLVLDSAVYPSQIWSLWLHA